MELYLISVLWLLIKPQKRGETSIILKGLGVTITEDAFPCIPCMLLEIGKVLLMTEDSGG